MKKPVRKTRHPSVSAKAARILRKVCRKVVKFPRAFEMLWWGDLHKKDAAHPCGAVACIAGTVVLIEQPDLYRDLASPVHDGKAHGLRPAAENLLGLDGGRALRLWSVSRWPAMWGKRYWARKGPKARAKVAAARLEYFIATGE